MRPITTFVRLLCTENKYVIYFVILAHSIELVGLACVVCGLVGPILRVIINSHHQCLPYFFLFLLSTQDKDSAYLPQPNNITR